MPSITLHGIPNCDTVKRARAWLAEAGVDVAFVDFKKAPPTVPQLRTWAQSVGWQTLLNRAGTTWRKLDEAAQALACDEVGAVALLATQPSAIKRPVVDWGDGRVTVGFGEERFNKLLAGERA